MKKRIEIIIMGIFVVGIVFGASNSDIRATMSTGDMLSLWGQTLSDFSKMDDNLSDIYAVGKTAIVYQKDIEQAMEFYKISGMNEHDAREKAEKYVLEREAMYQKAMEAGYGVTEQEIYDYLNELKELMGSAENKEDIRKVIEQFDSEEEYWNYQFEVYKKNLPIQNYVQDLKKESLNVVQKMVLLIPRRNGWRSLK